MSEICRFELAHRVISKWNLLPEQQDKVLPKNDFRAIENILFIHQALRLLFPNNPELQYSWVKGRKKSMNNKSPIDIILNSRDGIDEICETLKKMLYR